MIDAADRGLPIVYCDQTLFTRHTIKRTTYSFKYTHYRLDVPTQYLAPTRSNSFVSQNRDLVSAHTYSGEFNGKILMTHVQKVHKIMGSDSLAFLLDEAGPHKSAWVGD